MKYNIMEKDVQVIKQMKENGAFKNYIEYIDFPFYKNLVPRSRINFEFPLTVLIGKNGGGKSSTLHALFGAPQGYTCSDFWFSTEVDPIAESGDRNRYFYGYRENKNTEIKEVMKTRMKRGSETKKEDPDYWETSRPRKKDGMKPSKRNSPVNKEVVYLDFRAEVSAFDKVFHFSKDKPEERKEQLRKKSVYLKRLLDGDAMRYKGVQDSKMGKMEILPVEMVKIISNILNKNYDEIRVADHRLFQNFGTSVFLKNKFISGYSEANAGSGEIAVIQLVRRIERAEDYSLVLLDEPEVSLHPGAQNNLKTYLINVIKRKKLQIIIASHAPALIEGLPISAIKLFRTNEYGKFYIEENVHYQEAFYDIENRVSDKKLIYCEDYAAQMLINKTLKWMGKEQFFEIIYYHGGEKTLINHYMTPVSLNENLSNQIFVILDGDMQTDYIFDENVLTKEEIENPKYLSECVKKAFGMELDVYPDGGDGDKRADQQCDEYLKYLRYYKSNVFYFPEKMIPEEILLQSKLVKYRYTPILEKYGEINAHNAKEIILDISMFEHGDDTHVKDIISMLANKWSLEDSVIKDILVKDLNKIFQRQT